MAAAPREAASLVYPTDALKYRAAKAGLSAEEIDVIVNNNVKSLAQLTFAISPPGTSPSQKLLQQSNCGQLSDHHWPETIDFRSTYSGRGEHQVRNQSER